MAEERECWVEIVRRFMRQMHLVESTGSQKLILAKLDIERALCAGCKTPEEIVDFLHILEEGWFFSERIPAMSRLIDIRAKDAQRARARKRN